MYKNKLLTGLFACYILIASSCSVQKRIAANAKQTLLSNADFETAHLGISIYDPAAEKYLYNFQGDKLFVPASNTKILTCYAAMKNLGDSLIGCWYINKENGNTWVEGNGDASFLLSDFKSQPVFHFLQKQSHILLTDENWKDNALGFGWAWDDYGSYYMAERSPFPIYGNLVQFRQDKDFHAMPSFFQQPLEKAVAAGKPNFSIGRDYGAADYYLRPSPNKFQAADIPFYTGNGQIIAQLLADTLKTKVELTHEKFERVSAIKLYSQATDSLLKIMMHRSDNFFAEQTLLMISNEKLGMMSDSRIIDTLLKTDLAGLPQKAKWVDGSGLSRYNLVSPQDFVWVLTKMKKEFSWERIQTIFSTGGEGTLGGSYKKYAGRFYAKTGTLSNHVALSGYLITNKGKQLVFSVLVNAHLASAAAIRKGVENFLSGVIENY